MSSKAGLKKAVPIKVGYSGIFDFDGLYLVIAQWFKARKYWFHESTYKFKPGSEWGNEVEIKFKGEKNVTDFYMFEIEVYFHVWDMADVEVIQNGVKKKLTKGRMEIVISGDVTFDYQNKFTKSKFYERLYKFYIKFIVREKITDNVPDVLYYRMYKLQNLIKEYLDMQAKGNEYAGYLGDSV